MTDAPLSPRQRILEAVVTCIEQDGVNNLTTRRIAEQAGTNIAAINYYFRSKDLLVTEALAMTLRHMLGDLDALSAADVPFPQALEQALSYLIAGGQRFPGTIMAHFYPILVERRSDTPGAQSLRQAFDLLAERAVHSYPAFPPEQVRLALFQVVASVFFVLLSPGMLSGAVPLDLAGADAPAFLARYQTEAFLRILGVGAAPRSTAAK